ncbi:pyrroline-5-carboxylate reductase [Marinomonas mediterranea]|uniref:pyrroline-5-carboxylate reductase n=1 Tax=Marinomonas mediterranea TaxID=119864 RepID=UPI00234927BD|nr:pyrroline-5-carboxylate reductase [Marinomonas mediterranea]WCN10831.1 pyrroline-5-carboxylate reductase [Marinomonas mediterranea]
MSLRIAFIGVGNMASAIIGGLVSSGYPSDKICGTSLNTDSFAALEEKFGLTMMTSNTDAIAAADVVFLCVKPNQVRSVLEQAAEVITPSQMFVSVAAGVEIGSIESWLPVSAAVVRSMPNTPALVNCGASGLVANTVASVEQKEWISTVFKSFGDCVWVNNEEQMHQVTALSGSAPAYFFRVLESMIKSGVDQGMTEEDSRKLASLTMLGAAKMATELDESIAQLRINITSPNGTTEQALNSLNDANIDKVMDDAMRACVKRSKELAEEMAKS